MPFKRKMTRRLKAGAFSADGAEPGLNLLAHFATNLPLAATPGQQHRTTR
jgi:hypothetical protein